MHTRRRFPSRLSRRRGSALLVSLLLAAVIAISIGSFLRLATSSTKLSYRTYYAGVAMNVAECGLEQALWSLNRARTDPSTAWTNGWTYDSVTKSAKRTIDYGSIAGGATAVVKIYAREKRGNVPPMVISRAIITPGNDTPIEKWVQVDLRQRSRHDTGGVGRKGVTFSGNNTGVASWNSDPDNNPATPYIPWSAAVNNDEGSIASVEITSTIGVNNADVNGTAAIGGNNIDAINVGSQGYVGPFGTPAGTKDPDSVSTDFTTDLEDVSAPSATYTALGAVNDDLTLPKNAASDSHSTDSKTGITTYYYNASEISLTNKVLTITEGYNVVINVPNSNESVTVGGGSGAINVKTVVNNGVLSAASLHLYTPGNVKIAGQGAANESTVTTVTPSVTIPGTPASTTVIPATPATTVMTPQTTTVVTTTTLTPVGRVKSGNTVTGWNMKRSVSTVTTVTRSGSVVSTTPGGPTTTDYFDSTITSNSAPNVAVSSATTTTTATVPVEVPAKPEQVINTPATADTVIPGSTTVTKNIGQPVSFQVFGTRAAGAGTQSISISGNGRLSAVIYAPNADISVKGGGTDGGVYGSIIGNTIKFTGNEMFYYDESLGNLHVNTPYGIDEWDELVSYADRNAFGSLMNF